LREAALFEPSRVKIRLAVWPVGRSTKKGISEKNFRYISPICREAPNGRICTKFCTEGRLADIITCFKFCVDRLRVFRSAWGRIFHSPFLLSRSPLAQGCATARLWLIILWQLYVLRRSNISFKAVIASYLSYFYSIFYCYFKNQLLTNWKRTWILFLPKLLALHKAQDFYQAAVLIA